MSHREPQNPRVVLLEHHRHLDSLLDELLAAVRAGDRDACAQRWKKLEETLLRHLDVEEMFILPAIAGAHGPEVQRILKEHGTIRARLGEMGLALELHALRAESVEELCTFLREHAEREDTLAYAPAERRVTIDVARLVSDRLRRTVSTLKRGIGPKRARAPRAAST